MMERNIERNITVMTAEGEGKREEHCWVARIQCIPSKWTKLFFKTHNLPRWFFVFELFEESFQPYTRQSSIYRPMLLNAMINCWICNINCYHTRHISRALELSIEEIKIICSAAFPSKCGVLFTMHPVYLQEQEVMWPLNRNWYCKDLETSPVLLSKIPL